MLNKDKQNEHFNKLNTEKDLNPFPNSIKIGNRYYLDIET